MFDDDVIIIPGIPISEIQSFKGISISEEKINIPKSKYDPVLLTLSGNMNDYAEFSSGDKILHENYLQHSDHFSRILSEIGSEKVKINSEEDTKSVKETNIANE